MLAGEGVKRGGFFVIRMNRFDPKIGKQLICKHFEI